MIHLPLCNKQLKVVGTAGFFFIMALTAAEGQENIRLVVIRQI